MQIEVKNERILITHYESGVKCGEWNTIEPLKEPNGLKEQWGGAHDEYHQKTSLWIEKLESKNEKLQSNLSFIGNYEQNVRVGLWKYFYKQKQIGGGEFNKQGKKINRWRDINFLSENCSSIEKQIIYIGEYLEGIKIGQWDIEYENKIIGGGKYNDLGQKIGIWREIEDTHFKPQKINQQVNANQFMRENMKWSIEYQKQQIGGGLYDFKGLKVGQWRDIEANFFYKQSQSQIVQVGEYKQGQKVGQWSYYHKTDKIGGGNFNLEGQKTQIWREINLEYFNENSILIFEGKYIEGVRVDQWIIEFNKRKIGGGKFNTNGKKIGKWRDINFSYFQKGSQVIFEGEYKDGLRVGEWIIEFQKKKIGGGIYNMNGVKIGQWNDVDEELFSELSQIIYLGEYRNGIKIGGWNIQERNEKIGGGSFNEDGIKIGIWREINEKFYRQLFSQLIFQGKYNLGVKIGKWSIEFKGEIIGGGEYNDQGQKVGKWRDISVENYNELCQIVFEGNYKQGIRVDFWKIEHRCRMIGGGSYSQEGFKTGKWRDLKEKYFTDECQIVYEGDYFMGTKIGKWSIEYGKHKIGGGLYNQSGIKIGFWREIDKENFNEHNQMIYEGEYDLQGQRVGEWKQSQRQQLSLSIKKNEL